MVDIKSLSDIVEKYTRVTPGRAADYKAGVENPGKDWESATKNAEGNWATGVQSAISKKSFGRGVSEAGTAKWKEKSSTKGVDRWGPGVSAAGDDYSKGFAPFHAVIERTSLPARKETGNPANYERSKAIGEALHKAKVGS